jgi:hypothetical protein
MIVRLANLVEAHSDDIRWPPDTVPDEILTTPMERECQPPQQDRWKQVSDRGDRTILGRGKDLQVSTSYRRQLAVRPFGERKSRLQ